MLAEATKEFARGGAGGQSPTVSLLPSITGNKSASGDQPGDEPDSKTLPARSHNRSAKRVRELSASKANGRALAVRHNNRWKKLATLQAAFVNSLLKLGRGRLAFAVDQCHRTFRGCRCGRCSSMWAAATFSCAIRLCPWESRKRAMCAVHRFKPVLARMRDPRYMVLSMRNCPLDGLRDGIKAIFASFERLRHHALWRDLVTGAVVSMEITFNGEQRTWHPHLNILFDGSYIAQAALAEAWRKAARDEGLIVPYIRRANKGTLLELFKYTTKLADFVHIPEAVGAFLDATRRVRFIRTYGSLYGLKLACEGEDDEVPCCPDCGSSEVVVLRGCFTRDDVYFDGKGILRCCVPLDDPEAFQPRALHRAPPCDG